MMNKPQSNRWSPRVSRESDALTLEKGAFTQRSSRAIAASLNDSAERNGGFLRCLLRAADFNAQLLFESDGNKTEPRQAQGTGRRVLERAKEDLRELSGRDSESTVKRRTRDAREARPRCYSALRGGGASHPLTRGR